MCIGSLSPLAFCAGIALLSSGTAARAVREDPTGFEAACREALGQLQVLRVERADALEGIRLAAHSLRREDRRRSNEASPAQTESFVRDWSEAELWVAKLHRDVESLLLAWERELVRALDRAGPTRGGLERERIAALGLDVLESSLELDAPDGLLEALRARRSPLATALARQGDVARRRRFLSRAAERLVSFPGRSDVDVLIHVIRWEELFLSRVEPGAPLLDVLTRDLMEIFTERGPDGFSLSESELYHASLYRDFGFDARFRDDSDQLRHFAWALRLFVVSGGHGATEEVLRWKEHYDSRTDQAPLNDADLDLNRTLRSLVLELLGVAGDPARPPIQITGYAARIRRALTDAPAVR